MSILKTSAGFVVQWPDGARSMAVPYAVALQWYREGLPDPASYPDNRCGRALAALASRLRARYSPTLQFQLGRPYGGAGTPGDNLTGPLGVELSNERLLELFEGITDEWARRSFREQE